MTDRISLYNEILTVDERRIEYASLSFSFMHWNLVHQICKERINLTDINEKNLQTLLYNIFPGGNTILHLLIEGDQIDDIQQLF